MCRQLVALGANTKTELQCFRGAMLCMTVRSIGEGADLEVCRDGIGFRTRCSRGHTVTRSKKSQLQPDLPEENHALGERVPATA